MTNLPSLADLRKRQARELAALRARHARAIAALRAARAAAKRAAAKKAAAKKAAAKKAASKKRPAKKAPAKKAPAKKAPAKKAPAKKAPAKKAPAKKAPAKKAPAKKAPAKKAPTLTPLAQDAVRIQQLVREYPGGLAPMSYLRAHSGFATKRFDAAATRAIGLGLLGGHHHDFPQGLSAIERMQLLRVGRVYYTGLTIH